MAFLSYIVWAPDPDLVQIGGLTIRWYGLLFALGFLISQQIMFYIFRKEGKPERDVETLTIYLVIATIIGARLGHVLFYEPQRYLSNPMEILKIWEGGLASHGAAIGILLALYLYSYYDIHFSFKHFKGRFKRSPREGQSFLWIVDRIVIVVALTGCLVRFGNFMNSEIIGKPTESNYGVVFGRAIEYTLRSSSGAIEDVQVTKGKALAGQLNVEDVETPVAINLTFENASLREENVRNFIENNIKQALTGYGRIKEHINQSINDPFHYNLTQSKGAFKASILTSGVVRHPAQLYESFSSILIFVFLFLFWKKYRENTPQGRIFGLFLIVLFGLRFFYEFLKENQVAFESDIPLNMGQWLSIPLVLAGIILLIRSKKPKMVSSGE